MTIESILENPLVICFCVLVFFEYISQNLVKDKKTLLGWCFYDFANQPFTTIIVTFIYLCLLIK